MSRARNGRHISSLHLHLHRQPFRPAFACHSLHSAAIAFDSSTNQPHSSGPSTSSHLFSIVLLRRPRRLKKKRLRWCFYREGQQCCSWSSVAFQKKAIDNTLRHLPATQKYPSRPSERCNQMPHKQQHKDTRYAMYNTRPVLDRGA